MTIEEIKERLQGEYQNTLTGRIPEDSISLTGLTDLLFALQLPTRVPKGIDDGIYQKDLPDGIRILKNGNVMLNGKMLSKEARKAYGL